MPVIKPFPALRYDPHVVGDLGPLLCPPYDIIPPAQRDELARQPYNAIQLELPVADDGGDPYRRAARLLGEWRSRGVLRLDDRPQLYVYEQAYRRPGSTPADPPGRARGFFCRLGLEPFGAGVLRHERTMSAPKEDRFRLLSATRANLSPVLLLYRSASDGAASAGLLDALTEGQPTARAASGGVEQRLWAIDPAASAEAADLMALAAGQPLAIADGHHRYETALRYRDEVGGPGSDQLLALLYDADSGGLSVLPTHRLVRDIGAPTALLEGLGELFELEAHADAESLLAAIAGGGIGFWTRAGGAALRSPRAALEARLPAGSDALRALDVSAVAAALEQLTGQPAAGLDEQGKLDYTKDAGEAVARVAAGSADACFLLNATPVSAVLEVAAAGELMPPKSTYFVPKAATGLVFNLLSG